MAQIGCGPGELSAIGDNSGAQAGWVDTGAPGDKDAAADAVVCLDGLGCWTWLRYQRILRPWSVPKSLILILILAELRCFRDPDFVRISDDC